jgi:D-alanyl-D-alanine carboxypeptidase (penicillin-binding protein 5/6)
MEIDAMKRNRIALISVFALLGLPVQAAAPPFDTPAPVAFMKDLSSGAILYS